MLCVSIIQAEELAVVTSAQLNLPKLDAPTIERLFLLKTNHLGTIRIKVVELKHETIKSHFYAQISGKSLTQLRAYWTKLIFTGKAQPPKQLEDIDALRAMLKTGQNIVTYLPLEQVDASMQVLYTLKD